MKGRDRQKIQGANPHSKRPKLVDSFLQAMAHGELGEKWKQTRIVEFMSKSEFPVTIDTVKKSKNQKKIEPLKHFSPVEEIFAEYVIREATQLPLGNLVAPGSSASFTLKEIFNRK